MRISTGELLRRVKQSVDSNGGASAVARRLGVSRAYIHQMMNGDRMLSHEMLRLAGIRRVIRYELVEEAQDARAA